MDCTTILEAVAREADVPATQLEPPLYEVVDPDALNTLLAADGAPTTVRVEFDYAGHTILARSDGRLVVE